MRCYFVVYCRSSTFDGKLIGNNLDGLYRANMRLYGVCGCNGYGEDGKVRVDRGMENGGVNGR